MANRKKIQTQDNNNNVEDKQNKSFSLTSFLKDERTIYITALILFLISIFLVFSFVSYIFTWSEDQSKLTIPFLKYIFNPDITVENWAGKLGAYVAHVLYHNTFGIASLSLSFLIFVLALNLSKVNIIPFIKSLKYSIFITLWLSITLGFIFGTDYFYLGGAYGYYLAKWLTAVLGKIGTILFLFVSGFAFISITFKKTIPIIKNLLTRNNSKQHQFATPENSENQQEKNDSINIGTTETAEVMNQIELNTDSPKLDNINTSDVKETTKKEIIEIPANNENDVSLIIETSKTEEDKPYQINKNLLEEFGEFDIKLDAPKYQYPSIDLLEDYKDTYEVKEEELIANKNKIIETLKNYGIQITQIKATIGPTVTLYEIVPAPGIKISKIKSLEDDIALSLSALGIRIIAPIPGKGTIGIEVPNLNPQIVSMKSVIGSSRFQESKFDLPIAIGKTIQNEVFVFDLAKAPHILVAGATGQGKSVGLNAIITSLLFTKHPSELKFVMIDPKKIELSDYAKIEKHFLAKLPNEEEPIITDVQKVKNTLKSLTKEMDKRYDLLKQVGNIRTIKEYNEKLKKRELNPAKYPYLPYIVVIIDEFADLIITAGREIEEPIARLAQLARAVGIHLVIATQRPSTNIITGSIKANFPTRIAFRVTSMIDSRTILDTPGANQLIGRGDMLISIGSDLIRVQCAYIDSKEIARIVNHIEAQQAPPNPFYLPYVEEEQAINTVEKTENGKFDELFADAARLIVTHQIGSTSLIQRKFSIGYARAGRIMDQLEQCKIVGPQEGSKTRQVLVQDFNTLEQILKDLGF